MSSRDTLRWALGLTMLVAAPWACEKPGPTVVCYPGGECINSIGQVCDSHGQNCVNATTSSVNTTTSGSGGQNTSGSNTGTGTAGSTSATTTGGNTSGSTAGNPNKGANCHCPIVVGPANDINSDNDGDCLPNAVEHGDQTTINTPGHVTSGDPNYADTDGDGIRDGCEDRNHNGVLDVGEEDPTSTDTDADLLPDNIEDSNLDGVQDGTETSAVLADSDRDGIPDGTEDLDHDGQVKTWVDVNGNGKYDAGIDTPGESDPRNADTDADGIPDNFEDKNENGVYDASPTLHETIAWFNDTDGDLITDGKEDLNHNGAFDPGETDPTSTDTDGDGLADGLEDINHNGHWEVGVETSPVLLDSDNDGIADGVEDQNLNGKVDAFVDTNGNGCWDAGETAGESDPRKSDTDGDGIGDGLEDVNHNGLCDAPSAPDPLNPNNLVRTFVETCAWLLDTDCDGLREQVEDKNANGSVDVGETDPRRLDTDFDGLSDGCPATNAATGCEDKNNNGQVDSGETDPTRPDSDGDLLPDGCEVNFGPHPPTGGTNPLNIDTDGDGVADGDEDLNHNCVVDNGETDPRVYNTPPAPNTSTYPQWSVCSPENLNSVSYAASARPTHDFRLALEMEKTATGACSGGTCPAGETCVDNQCILQSQYTVSPYGKDIDGNGFNANDANDLLYGFVFQSPQGILTDPNTGFVESRDVYGFVQVGENTSNQSLDDILANYVSQITSYFGVNASITPGTVLPSRASFDSGPGYQVVFGQQQMSVTFAVQMDTALHVRNNILENVFLNGTAPDPPGTPPTTDPVYGLISQCSSGVPHCYIKFKVYIGGVMRMNQQGPTGKPVVITTVALTPDDSNPVLTSSPQTRLFNDRVTRLQDLTGGASLARYEAGTGMACDHMPQTMARADMVWVVDDSKSMQAIIQKVQLAANAAKNVLSANAGIVDVRVGMTTTNPSLAARTVCPGLCQANCQDTSVSGTACQLSCADQTLGCIKTCPDSCAGPSASPPPTCTGATCTCNTCGTEGSNEDCCPGFDNSANAAECRPSANPNTYGRACADPNQLTGASGLVMTDAQSSLDFRLPGGGGTFYYESSFFMDCKSVDSQKQSQDDFLNQCIGGTYSQNANLQAFFPGGALRGTVLTGNAGMLHIDPNANCTTSPLTLYFDAGDPNSYACSTTDPTKVCCQRLTATCTDGPTVLASQMCDLIRGMGGVPGDDGAGFKYPTASARRHSAPEMGTRSARRLLQSMLPAYPYDSTDPNAVTHARRTCSTGDAGCGTCDPTADTNCVIFPVATMILSDEEDFWFKDECMQNTNGDQYEAMKYADRQQLPGAGDKCLYVNGDPNNPGTCSDAYCAGYFTNPNVTNATGYNPEQTGLDYQGDYTLQYTSPSAPECAPSNPNNCMGDPCVGADQATCNSYSICAWNPNYYDPSTPNTPTPFAGCINRCALHTLVNKNEVISLSQAAVQAAACNADPLCYFDQSQVQPNEQDPLSSPPGACVDKYAHNDCQACKRYLRKKQAFAGEPNMVGFRTMGPVYAITRNKLAPGEGTFDNNGLDACNGGYLTWGRGDGQAYRDLAALTAGITQDVCQQDYTQFMQEVTADLAVLSTPYPLTQNPIPATLKVGLSRDNGDGTFSYIVENRSSTTGFFYDATHNSIGFKSDPVDGACASNAGCAADGNIDPSEVLYALTLPTVPRPGDIVYVSYHIWNPVPCGGGCPAGETCAQVICRDDGSTCGSCANSGDVCTLGTCCTPGQVIDACVNAPACGACQTYDTTSHTCQSTGNLCACNPGHGQTCSPNAANTCSIGFACDETCVCEAVPGCAAGTFKGDGTVTDCTAALACCQSFDSAAAACSGKNNTDCTAAAPNCVWRNNACIYAFQTCCSGNSQAECAIDPESGTRAIFCSPGACSCATTTCPAGQDCDPGNNCQCFLNGG